MDDRNPEDADGPDDLAPAEAPVPPARRWSLSRASRAAAFALALFGVLVVVVVPAGFLIRLPYVVISPGFATPLGDEIIEVDGARTYEHRGDLMFLTVRVTTRNPTVWRVVTGWLDPDREVVKRSAVVGCLSDEENTVINDRLMAQSQDDAKEVALTRLGYDVVAGPPEIVIIEVCPGVPAHGDLRAGDEIVAIDDEPVDELDDVAPLVRAHAPGEPIDVTYVRDRDTKTARVVAGRVADDTATDGGPGPAQTCRPVQRVTSGTACLGVTMQSFVDYEFPIDVSIDTRQVGGPSAGLAFALAIIDRLTPGDLTGGERVAVTGTIVEDGSVGAVGGVEQKAITARHNDVTLMIVPRSEVADARAGASGMRIVGVETIDDALQALQKAGGTGLPPVVAMAARS